MAKQPVITITGGPYYAHGPMTITEGWLEPRKWWQFWKPQMVEKFVTYEVDARDTNTNRNGEVAG